MNDSKTLQMLITEMVAKTDEVMSKYYDKILASDYTFTRNYGDGFFNWKEGSKLEDRKKISSVFHKPY